MTLPLVNSLRRSWHASQRRRRMMRHLALPLALLPAIMWANTPARGAVIYSTTLSNLPGDSNINELDLGSGTGNQLVSNALWYFGGTNTVSFTGSAGIYHGTSSGLAAAPTLNGSQITTNYFAAEPSGAVTFNYSAPQKYFGLLWGSVDTYNSLSFYDGATLVATFVGNQITANPTGSQAADGSFFVSFNFTDSTQYTSVIATSTSPAFEFNAMGYASVNIPLASGTGTPNVITLSSVPVIPAPGGGAVLPALVALTLIRGRGRRA
jgi:hypothetical protein